MGKYRVFGYVSILYGSKINLSLGAEACISPEATSDTQPWFGTNITEYIPIIFFFYNLIMGKYRVFGYVGTLYGSKINLSLGAEACISPEATSDTQPWFGTNIRADYLHIYLQPCNEEINCF
jgi:hypothetical protein